MTAANINAQARAMLSGLRACRWAPQRTQRAGPPGLGALSRPQTSQPMASAGALAAPLASPVVAGSWRSSASQTIWRSSTASAATMVSMRAKSA